MSNVPSSSNIDFGFGSAICSPPASPERESASDTSTTVPLPLLAPAPGEPKKRRHVRGPYKSYLYRLGKQEVRRGKVITCDLPRTTKWRNQSCRCSTCNKVTPGQEPCLDEANQTVADMSNYSEGSIDIESNNANAASGGEESVSEELFHDAPEDNSDDESFQHPQEHQNQNVADMSDDSEGSIDIESDNAYATNGGEESDDELFQHPRVQQNQTVADLSDDSEGSINIEIDNACATNGGEESDDEELFHDAPEDNTDDDSFQHPQEEQNQKDSDKNNPLFTGASVTLQTALLLVMSFFLAHNLTSAAQEDFLRLLGLLLPATSSLPRTSYLFNKHFKSDVDVDFHVYCPDCLSYLGKEEQVSCMVCNKTYFKAYLKDKGFYFITLGLRDQLMKLLKCEELASQLSLDRRYLSEEITDISDGEMYKRLPKNALSLTMNCDGIPIYKSSNASLWPVQVTLNELPPKLRKENIILAGLWFGPSKPSMYAFLRPFTEELKDLASAGIEWNQSNSTCIQSKVILSICACDSVARCMLQGIKQFNGEYGCGWCLNKGEVVAKGRGYVRAYAYNDVDEDKRTDKSIRAHAAQAVETNSPVFGVKGPSPLFKVPNFNLVSGFPPDPLHAIFLGVGRQLASLWLDSSNHREQFYLGGSLNEIDRKLSNFYPPTEVTRTPRPISDRVHWKASEWRNWILFYSIIVLKGILRPKFLHHWMLLVHSIYILSAEKIRPVDLTTAENALKKFVKQFKDLYGRNNMSFNIHQLLHLVESVRNWGPLWTHSSAWYEGNLGSLSKLFHGTNRVPKQIASKFVRWSQVTDMFRSEKNLSRPVEEFLSKFLTGFGYIQRGIEADVHIHYLGASSQRSLTLEEQFSLPHLHNGQDQAQFYQKAIINSVCIHTVNYRRHNTRINYCVHLNTGQAAFVQNFVKLERNNETYALVKLIEFDTSPILMQDHETRACASHIKVVKRIQNSIHALHPSTIVGKYVVYKDMAKIICCHLPNLVERD